MTPEISVVIPTRNRWSVLGRALRCALGQADVALEVLVLDDGSTEDPPAELRELGDPRVRLLRLPGRGVAQARNSGIQHARGTWIAFMDDDDLWAPSKLRSQLAAAAEAQAVFAFASALLVDVQLLPLRVQHAPDPADLSNALRGGNPLPAGSSNVIARSHVLRELGGFDSRLSHLADWDLWIRLASAGRAAACDEQLVAYVQHSANMRAHDSSGLLAEIRHIDEKHGLSGDVERHPERRYLLSFVAAGYRASGHPVRAAALELRTALRFRDRGAARTAAGALLTAPFPAARRGASVVPQPANPRPPCPAWLAAHVPPSAAGVLARTPIAPAELAKR